MTKVRSGRWDLLQACRHPFSKAHVDGRTTCGRIISAEKAIVESKVLAHHKGGVRVFFNILLKYSLFSRIVHHTTQDDIRTRSAKARGSRNGRRAAEFGVFTCTSTAPLSLASIELHLKQIG